MFFILLVLQFGNKGNHNTPWVEEASNLILKHENPSLKRQKPRQRTVFYGHQWSMSVSYGVHQQLINPYLHNTKFQIEFSEIYLSFINVITVFSNCYTSTYFCTKCSIPLRWSLVFKLQDTIWILSTSKSINNFKLLFVNFITSEE